MTPATFEILYRNNLWRVELSSYQDQPRLSIWAHYRDRETGEWKACGGRRETPGCIVPPDRIEELQAVIGDIAERLQSAGAQNA